MVTHAHRACMIEDAAFFAERCSICWRKRSNPTQELMPTEIKGVWKKLTTDIVTVEGHHLLSIVDYGSHYPELVDLSSTTTVGVINKLMEVFARLGLPVSLESDDGPSLLRLRCQRS